MDLQKKKYGVNIIILILLHLMIVSGSRDYLLSQPMEQKEERIFLDAENESKMKNDSEMKNEFEMNDGIELQSVKSLQFEQIIFGKDERNFKRHLSIRIEKYIDKQELINIILESKNSHYIKDDLIDLRRIPVWYIAKYPYYFDYVNPLQWITADNINLFVNDFQQLLHDTAITNANDDEMKSIEYLPKVKFYDEVMRQLFESEDLATTHNPLIQFLIEHVTRSIKCKYASDSVNHFLFIIKKCNDSYRIFTWSQAYRLCKHPSIDGQVSPTTYIKIDELLTIDDNYKILDTFYGCWQHEKIDLYKNIFDCYVCSTCYAMYVALLSLSTTGIVSIYEHVSGESRSEKFYTSLMEWVFLTIYLNFVLPFSVIYISQYVVRTLYINHCKYKRFFSRNYRNKKK